MKITSELKQKFIELGWSPPAPGEDGSKRKLLTYQCRGCGKSWDTYSDQYGMVNLKKCVCSFTAA